MCLIYLCELFVIVNVKIYTLQVLLRTYSNKSFHVIQTSCTQYIYFLYTLLINLAPRSRATEKSQIQNMPILIAKWHEVSEYSSN